MIKVGEGRLIGMVWHLLLLVPLIGVLSAPACAAEPGHKRIMILQAAGTGSGLSLGKIPLIFVKPPVFRPPEAGGAI
jgi:hypothetical protein